MAAQLAAWNGATVIGTVRRSSDLNHVDDAVDHRVALDAADPVGAIRDVAPDGVDRVVEVSFSDNADLDAAVAAPGSGDRRLRDARPATGSRLLADALRQPHDPPARQRRLPRRG